MATVIKPIAWKAKPRKDAAKRREKARSRTQIERDERQRKIDAYPILVKALRQVADACDSPAAVAFEALSQLGEY